MQHIYTNGKSLGDKMEWRTDQNPAQRSFENMLAEGKPVTKDNKSRGTTYMKFLEHANL
jgi:hypothetical protein